MDILKTKKYLTQRYQRRKEALEKQRITLLNKLETKINHFVQEFPTVERVIIFGSLIKPGYFNEFSDVDIAVENLPNSKYWQAFGWFENLLDMENIDLVRIEEARPSILKYIKQGKIIYDRKPGKL